MATMLLNLAWAVGETVGAPAAAGLSQATTDAVPLLILSAIMVLTLRPVFKARLTAPAHHETPERNVSGRAEVGSTPALEPTEPARRVPDHSEPAPPTPRDRLPAAGR
jgi:hypothetical protein